MPTEAIYDIERVFRPNSRAQPPLIIGGFNNRDRNKTKILQLVHVPFVTNAECVKEYQDLPHVTIRKEYFCAGGQIKISACIGNKKLILLHQG